jgi:hypothetical protein
VSVKPTHSEPNNYLEAVETDTLQASDGRVRLTVGDGINYLFVYPTAVTSTGEFAPAVLQVADVRAGQRRTVVRRRGGRFLPLCLVNPCSSPSLASWRSDLEVP